MNSGTLTKYLFLCKIDCWIKKTILLYEKNAENFFTFSIDNINMISIYQHR